jgi:hypothetical protein
MIVVSNAPNSDFFDCSFTLLGPCSKCSVLIFNNLFFLYDVSGCNVLLVRSRCHYHGEFC